jgi:hypothetical protein
MDNFFMILVGIGFLLLAWFIYRKFIVIPTHPSKCEMRCEDGVCFPSCPPSTATSLSHNSDTNSTYTNSTVQQNLQNLNFSNTQTQINNELELENTFTNEISTQEKKEQ